MIKVSIQGSEAEISAFFERIKEADGLSVQYKSTLQKRDASHAWASCKAGINAASKSSDAKLRVEIRSRSPKKKAATKQGYVYLMPAYSDKGIIGYKIGKTMNPHSRRKTFGVKFNFSVHFLALIFSDDYSKLEKELHSRYKSQRKGKSEFFELQDVEVKQIMGMMTQRDKELLAELKNR